MLPQGSDPAGGKPFWSASGTGFKYRDARGANGPVRIAQITRSKGGTFQLKAVALGKNGAITLVPPNPGASACLRLDVAGGDSYHVVLPPAPDSTIKRNDARTFLVKDAVTEGLCPPICGNAIPLPGGGCASIVRASVDTAGGDPNSGSGMPSLSANGRYVAFQSFASDLVAGDGNGADDIFVRDLQAGTTIRVSVDTAGGDANGGSRSPSISADGRYVAFDSSASDLVLGDDNALQDVFVRDVQTGVTTRVRAATTGLSLSAALTADGRFVAFQSTASDLVPGDGNSALDVFVRALLVPDRQLATGSVAPFCSRPRHRPCTLLSYHGADAHAPRVTRKGHGVDSRIEHRFCVGHPPSPLTPRSEGLRQTHRALGPRRRSPRVWRDRGALRTRRVVAVGHGS